MPAPATRSFSLIPHPAVSEPALESITGHVARTTDGVLSLNYVLKGDLDRLRLPARREPAFVDMLWRHTCCEAFVRRKDAAAYHEFNVSPSGEWAVYAFARQRERAPLGGDAERFNPHVTVCRSDGKLELDAVIRLDRLSLEPDARLALGLSAVIEDVHGSLSYWALRHPLAHPDFHHPDAFALELA